MVVVVLMPFMALRSSATALGRLTTAALLELIWIEMVLRSHEDNQQRVIWHQPLVMGVSF